MDRDQHRFVIEVHSIESNGPFAKDLVWAQSSEVVDIGRPLNAGELAMIIDRATQTATAMAPMKEATDVQSANG